MKKIVLCILDGIGLREEIKGNAFKLAKTPTYDYLIKEYPSSKLEASGLAVGLPEGQMGNSEVGHLSIGAGRVIYQPLPRITKDIKESNLENKQELKNVINHKIENNSSLHIMGLLSDGGVHSHIDHLFGLIDIINKKTNDKVYLHLFLDGRDTSPTSGIKYMEKLENKIKNTNIKIATISGRFYAMDRDNRFERIQASYEKIMNKEITEKNINTYINESYKKDITDEFIKPARFIKEGTIGNNDSIIVFNFRPDRIKELFTAITNQEFTEFETKKLENIKTITMYPASEEIMSTPVYTPDLITNTLGEEISKNNLSQLRIAETEKYAHVTYFFDGGLEQAYPGMTKTLIPSPKVETYDLKPEMSAKQVTDKLIEQLKDIDVTILNFANGDMVGHTGNLDATISSIEFLDKELKRIYKEVKKHEGTLIVTSDHGNCEYMEDELGNKITAHTTNKVPFLITDKTLKLSDGSLVDIAPTILDMLKIPKPSQMTGKTLINK